MHETGFPVFDVTIDFLLSEMQTKAQSKQDFGWKREPRKGNAQVVDYD